MKGNVKIKKVTIKNTYIADHPWCIQRFCSVTPRSEGLAHLLLALSSRRPEQVVKLLSDRPDRAGWPVGVSLEPST